MQNHCNAPNTGPLKEAIYVKQLTNKIPKNADDLDEKNKSRVRKLSNGDIVIPFSCVWVLKKIENFKAETSSFDVTMTMVLMFKFTGLPNIEMVMDLCRAKKVEEFENEAL